MTDGEATKEPKESQPEKCKGCGHEPSAEKHKCPYAEEIHFDHALCDCCDWCTEGCARQI